MKPTREGVRFILAAALIGLAALNTGNNLIYLILSLMASFVLLSLVILRMTLSGLSARVVLPHPVFAGEPVAARIILENRSGRIPAYSVHVSVADRRIASRPAYRIIIPPGGVDEAAPVLTFRRRGRYDAVACELSSSFPFVLFLRRREVVCAAGVTVYPQVRDVSVREGLRGRGGVSSPAPAMRRGDELHSLREYRPGDDVRTIHWKASAKTGALIVREFAENEAARMTLIVDNLRRPAGTGQEADEAAEAFEKQVSLAASLSRHFLNAGYQVRLVSCRATIPFGAGQDHFLALLDHLAVIEPEDAWDEQLPAGEDGVLVIAGGDVGGAPSVSVPGGVVVHASDV